MHTDATIEQIVQYTPWYPRWSKLRYVNSCWFDDKEKIFNYSFGGCIGKGTTVLQAAINAVESYERFIEHE